MIADIIQRQGFALGFAACAHRNQKRKYTGAPYISHCYNVARMVAKFIDDEDIIVAAILHDTIEDCGVTEEEIRQSFNRRVSELVMEVTDVSRSGHGNREERKKLDRDHLAKSSYGGASIKLADLIDNTSTIVKYDTGFAKIYLHEKELLLPFLSHGDSDLYLRAKETLRVAQLQLGVGHAD